MAPPASPPLYRTARWISRIASIVALVLVILVAATVYSATQIRPGESKGQGLEATLVNGGIDLQLGLNFSNPGFLPISNVHLASVVNSPNNVTLLARGSSPNVSVAAGSMAVVPLTIFLPLGANSPLMAYLTHDAELPTEVWANVTVSSLFSVNVNISTTYHWGAPFAHLNLTPGTPSAANGTVTVPFTLSFSNDASFAVDGTLSLVASGSGGCSATVPPIALSVPPGGGYQQTFDATAPASCATSTWSSVGGSFQSSLWSGPLPTEAIP